jgi:predicted site-specific integrase-resolvase
MASQEDHIYRDFRSLHCFLKEVGVSKTTGWRWRKRGWLKTVNIAGQPYVSQGAINEFLLRSEKGEFSKEARCPSKKRRLSDAKPAKVTESADNKGKLPRLAFSMEETAEVLGISSGQVQELMEKGLLKASKDLFPKIIPRTEIERFLQSTLD